MRSFIRDPGQVRHCQGVLSLVVLDNNNNNNKNKTTKIVLPGLCALSFVILSRQKKTSTAVAVCSLARHSGQLQCCRGSAFFLVLAGYGANELDQFAELLFLLS